MPYEWIEPASSKAPVELHAWPYRSLPRRGFVIFIGATCLLFLAPVTAVIGTPVLWALLPFLLAAIGGIWWALERSYRDGGTLEELRLWQDKITLHRHDPRRPSRDWEANPHWVRLILHREHRIENYLTLQGGPREVELGAFLTAEERQQLFHDINARLSAMNTR